MVKDKIILPEEFKDEHSSLEYLNKLIGKRIRFAKDGYTTKKITTLLEVHHRNFYKSMQSIEKLKYEESDGWTFVLDWIVAVMLIEGGYAEDAIGFKYYVVED